MTSGYPDWLRAFLLLGQHAGTYLPVLLGPDGSMYATLQGDYLGSPMPIRIDADGQLYMYITDVPDQFGNRSNIGIGELAARIVGWPVSYDRRGQIMFFEQFDSGWGNFHASLYGGGSAALYVQGALQGGTCVRLATPATSPSYVDLHGAFPLVASTTSVGMACFLAPVDTYTHTLLTIDYRLAPDEYYGQVKLVQADATVWVNTPGVGWVQVGTWTPNSGTSNWWYYIKLVIDLATQKYKRIILQGTEIDVSAYDLVTAVSAPSYLGASVALYGSAAGIGSCLLDCITLTTQEP